MNKPGLGETEMENIGIYILKRIAIFGHENHIV